MNCITNDELKEILGRHVLWLNGDPFVNRQEAVEY